MCGFSMNISILTKRNRFFIEEEHCVYEYLYIALFLLLCQLSKRHTCSSLLRRVWNNCLCARHRGIKQLLATSLRRGSLPTASLYGNCQPRPANSYDDCLRYLHRLRRRESLLMISWLPWFLFLPSSWILPGWVHTHMCIYWCVCWGSAHAAPLLSVGTETCLRSDECKLHDENDTVILSPERKKKKVCGCSQDQLRNSFRLTEGMMIGLAFPRGEYICRH